MEPHFAVYEMLNYRDAEIATNLRHEGNSYYNRWEFFEALEMYNRSLCAAFPGSQECASVFANRSAVYFHANELQLCLENIQLARKCGYQKRDLLDGREERCMKLMKKHQPGPDDNPWDFFKLSYKANKKIPFAVNCLELRNNTTYGNHIITNRGKCLTVRQLHELIAFFRSEARRCARN